MKKYLIFIFTLLFLFIPIGVNAVDVTPSLECPASVKKGAPFTCKIYANITGADLETLPSLSGNVSVNSTYLTLTSSSSFNKTGPFSQGNKVLIGDITGTAKTVAGVGTVTLSGISGDAGDSISTTSITQNIRVLDDAKDLSDIKIDNVTINDFNSATKNYNLSVDKEKIVLTATKTAATSSISGTGTISLRCGANSTSLIVTAEDKTSSVYQLNISRKCNENVTLKGITLSSGALDPVFNPATKAYTVNVSKDIDKISITANKNDKTQKVNTITDAKLNFGANKFELTVESEVGKKEVYTITVNREDGRNSDPTLKNIILSDGKLNFAGETFEYQVKVLYDVTKITVNAEATAVTSKISVVGGDNLKVGENVITIKVTAENGATAEYIIKVNRLEEGETLGDNPNPQNITIKNYDFAFDKEKLEYTLKIGDESSLDITVLMEEEGATFEIEGNSNLKNKSIIKIITTSADGTTKTYRITIQKDIDSMLIFIAAGLIVLIAVILIVSIVIKKKKTKNKNESNDKEEIKEEPAVIEEVQNNQININNRSVTINDNVESLESFRQSEPVKPVENLYQERVFPVEEPIESLENIINEPEPLQEEPKLYQGTLYKDNYPTSINSAPSMQREVQAKRNVEIDEIQERRNLDTNTAELETKICSICGHRVPKSTIVCPYCKRTW